MNEAGSRMKKLLNNVAELSKAREVIYRVTGEKFNIFSILNIGGREFFICKVLKELLSPSGSHCQGILFLRPFVKNVLRLNIPDTELAGARVYSEHYTFQGRYIDIVIETANYFIAIEVKITAKDLNRQCIDYYEEAKHRCADENNAKILYSSPGKMPKRWTLSPYDFYFRGNAWYMASYNHKYDNLSIHRISRIISASINDEEYVKPEDGGFTEDYTLSAWHVIPGDEKISVKVRISEPLAQTFREVKWHPSQKVEDCKEGGVILSAEVPNLYEFARWVMSGAPHVIVIEPEELKEIVRNFAEEIISQL